MKHPNLPLVDSTTDMKHLRASTKVNCVTAKHLEPRLKVESAIAKPRLKVKSMAYQERHAHKDRSTQPIALALDCLQKFPFQDFLGRVQGNAHPLTTSCCHWQRFGISTDDVNGDAEI